MAITTMSSISRVLVNSPGVRTRYFRCPTSMEPPGMVTFSDAMAATTSEKVSS